MRGLAVFFAGLLLRLLTGMAIIIAVLLAGTWFHLRSSLPDYAGSITVPGLGGAVDIVRDDKAIPHIFAGSIEDAAFGLGFAHAQDRLWQMEVMRRVAAGRLSEVVPPRVAGNAILDIDRTMRGLAVYASARDSLSALSPRVRAVIDAYTAGVNGYIGAHRGAFGPEFALLMHRPEPWAPADTVVWGKLMALSLDGNWRSELLRLRLLKAIGEERMRQFQALPGDSRDSTLSLLGEALLRLPLDRLFATTDNPWTEKREASNEWVVDGAHSVTGKPLLGNDPHLGLTAPGTWYLARLVVPGLDIRGATAPGSPAVVLGHNGRIGWGFTTTNLDSQDLFVEKVDPTDPGRYVTPEGTRPFGTRREEIRVRWGDPIELRVRQTRHGVVVTDLLPDAARAVETGHVLALAATALDRADTSAEGFFGLMLARNWNEFTDATRRILSPMQNIVFADTEGNIGFVAPARVPLRRKGDGFLPAPGWTGEYDWAGTVPFDELPRAFNPPGGIIVNANARVVGADFRHFITHDWAEPYRQRQAHALLRRSDQHSVESMIAMQADNLAADAVDMLPLMLAIEPQASRAREAIGMLRLWDRRMRADRPEPLIYTAWLRELHRALYADELGEELFRTSLNPTVAFLASALREHHAWCDNIGTPRVETCADTVQVALERALDWISARYGNDMATWRWGRAHQAVHRHGILDMVPLLRRAASVRFRADGGMHSLNRASPNFRDSETPFAAVHGAGFRVIYDFADLDRSLFAIPLGQSGNFLSPWYADRVPDWRSFRYLRIAGPRYLVERGGIGTLSLRRP
jgi:penicillin amidase